MSAARVRKAQAAYDRSVRLTNAARELAAGLDGWPDDALVLQDLARRLSRAELPLYEDLRAARAEEAGPR